MRSMIAFVLFAGIASLTSCEPRSTSSTPATPAARAEFGGWSWYAIDKFNPEGKDVCLNASWGTLNQKLVYVLVTDSTVAATTGMSDAGERTAYLVSLKLPLDRKADLRIETPDGKTGRAVYAEQSFDLVQGSVFVLLPSGDRFAIRQFQRDTTNVVASALGVQKFVQDDAELLRLFAKPR